MLQVFITLLLFLEHPVDLFWSNLIPFSWNSRVWSFFSSILGIKTFIWEVLKVFWVVLMKDKSSHIKNWGLPIFFLWRGGILLLGRASTPLHALNVLVTNRLMLIALYADITLRGKCPNKDFFLTRIFLYSGWIREIRTRKNFVFGHSSRSVKQAFFQVRIEAKDRDVLRFH